MIIAFELILDLPNVIVSHAVVEAKKSSTRNHPMYV
jgi:hypothetical protein